MQIALAGMVLAGIGAYAAQEIEIVPVESGTDSITHPLEPSNASSTTPDPTTVGLSLSTVTPQSASARTITSALEFSSKTLTDQEETETHVRTVLSTATPTSNSVRTHISSAIFVAHDLPGTRTLLEFSSASAVLSSFTVQELRLDAVEPSTPAPIITYGSVVPTTFTATRIAFEEVAPPDPPSVGPLTKTVTTITPEVLTVEVLDDHIGTTRIIDRGPDVTRPTPGGVTEFRADGDQEVVLGTATSTVSITVAPQARNPVLVMTETLRDVPGGKAAMYQGDLRIVTGTTGASASVSILPMTTMTGPAHWNGVMRLPTFVDSPAAGSAAPGAITSMIVIGLDGDSITFDRPVRILFHGKAGHDAGFERAGQADIIDVACASDRPADVARQLGGAGDCKIDAGRDLAIWTFHFTRFYTLMPTQPIVPTVQTPVPVVPTPAPTVSTPAEPAASAPINRGGGGGGGGGGSVTGTGAAGSAVPTYIRSVSWDCEAGKVEVEAGPDVDGLTVTVLSKTLGLSTAELQDDAAPGYGVFESPMDSEDDFIQVRALSVGGRDFSSATESLNLNSCAGTRIFQTEASEEAPTLPVQQDPAPVLVQAETGEDVKDAPAPAEPRDEPEPPERATEQPAGPEPAPQKPECGPGTELGPDGACRVVQDSSGCLIATAAHGTEMAEQVQRLREIRDGKVLSTGLGSEFMGAFNGIYYSFSPAVADAERQNPALRHAAAAALAPMLATLHVLDFAEAGSEAHVAGLGILVIALNVAVYGSPALAAGICMRAKRARSGGRAPWRSPGRAGGAGAREAR